jgi:KDO2-lipid IV(A) lauroyltransferase
MGRRRTPWVQQLIWRLEALAFDAFTRLARSLPMDGVSWAFGRIAMAVGPLTRAHRTALLGLKIAFPEKSNADRGRLARAQWENFGRYIGEFPLVDRITPERGRVEIEGFERLRAIALSGRPAILISGHFSNIEVMAAAILSAGIVCDVTYRAANNPLVDARIIAGRARYGVRLFAPKGADGARSLLTNLAAGRSIAILNDQKYDGGLGGVFFGEPVRTNPAAARLARKYGAVIQPMSVRRTRGARFQVIVHDPIVVPHTEDRGADIDHGVDAINAFIEERVRERPEEWWWMHRRWPAEVYQRASEKAT